MELLRTTDGGVFVDCTLGTGGHSERILRDHPTARVIGIDRDPEAVAVAEGRLASFGSRFRAVHTDYRNIEGWKGALEGHEPNGILADLGMSTLQLRARRGFSFQDGDSLDMRMDPTGGETAGDLINGASERTLAATFREYGEERHARRIAAAVVRRRIRAPIEDAATLAALVEEVVPKPRHPARRRMHPATRVFQALRIRVNRELEGLGDFLLGAFDLLATGGRFVVIAYHSLEDRIVKNAFRDLAGRCTCPPGLPVCACGAEERMTILTRRPLRPGKAEVEANASARSARLRAGEKR